MPSISSKTSSAVADIPPDVSQGDSTGAQPSQGVGIGVLASQLAMRKKRGHYVNLAWYVALQHSRCLFPF